MRYVFLPLFFLTVLSACSNGPVEVKYRGQSMGTSWSVKINSSVGYSPELAQAIQAELDLVDELMSNWKDNSDISRFNRSEINTCTEVSKPTLAVVLVSQRISTLSQGAFDISLSPLIDLWGFGSEFKSSAAPTEEEITEKLEQVGIRNIYLTDTALCKIDVPVTLNVSGLAKGFAVDRVAALLSDEGFSDYLVEVGGELRALGNNGRDAPWTIGVEQPTDELGGGVVQTALPLIDSAVATSGDYRNFFEIEGARFSHIIDPVTGYPVTHNAASVTVLAKSSMEADAWATALLVLGPEKGMEIAEQQKLPVLMILRAEEGFQLVSTDDWPQS